MESLIQSANTDKVDLSDHPLVRPDEVALFKSWIEENKPSEVVLSNCQLTDEVAEALLSSCLANDNLRALNLMNNRVEERGCELLLALLASNKGIESINLLGNPILRSFSTPCEGSVVCGANEIHPLIASLLRLFEDSSYIRSLCGCSVSQPVLMIPHTLRFDHEVDLVVAELKKNTDLKSLQMFCDGSSQELLSVLDRNKTLIRLFAVGFHLSQPLTNPVALSASQSLKTLQILWNKGDSIQDAEELLAWLEQNLSSNTQLSTLQLDGLSWTNSDLLDRLSVIVRNNRGLVHLALFNSLWTEDGKARLLAAFSDNSTLRLLHVVTRQSVESYQDPLSELVPMSSSKVSLEDPWRDLDASLLNTIVSTRGHPLVIRTLVEDSVFGGINGRDLRDDWEVGDHVEALVDETSWVQGEILAVTVDFKYSVLFGDGQIKSNIRENKIRGGHRFLRSTGLGPLSNLDFASSSLVAPTPVNNQSMDGISKAEDETNVNDAQRMFGSSPTCYFLGQSVVVRFCGDCTWVPAVIREVLDANLYLVQVKGFPQAHEMSSPSILPYPPLDDDIRDNFYDPGYYVRGDYVDVFFWSTGGETTTFEGGVWKRGRVAHDNGDGTYFVRLETNVDLPAVRGRQLRFHFRAKDIVDVRLRESMTWCKGKVLKVENNGSYYVKYEVIEEINGDIPQQISYQEHNVQACRLMPPGREYVRLALIKHWQHLMKRLTLLGAENSSHLIPASKKEFATSDNSKAVLNVYNNAAAARLSLRNQKPDIGNESSFTVDWKLANMDNVNGLEVEHNYSSTDNNIALSGGGAQLLWSGQWLSISNPDTRWEQLAYLVQFDRDDLLCVETLEDREWKRRYLSSSNVLEVLESPGFGADEENSASGAVSSYRLGSIVQCLHQSYGWLEGVVLARQAEQRRTYTLWLFSEPAPHQFYSCTEDMLQPIFTRRPNIENLIGCLRKSSQGKERISGQGRSITIDNQGQSLHASDSYYSNRSLRQAINGLSETPRYLPARPSLEQKKQSSFVSPRHTHRQLVQPSPSPGRSLPDSIPTSSAATTMEDDILRVYHFPVLDLGGVNLVILRYMPSSTFSREVEYFQHFSYFTVQVCCVLSDNRRLPLHCATPMQDGKAPLLWNIECPVFPILVGCVDAGDAEEGNVRVIISLYYKAILVSSASLSLRGCFLRGNSSGILQFVDFDMWEPQVVVEFISKPIIDHETTPLKERIDDVQRVLSKSKVSHVAVNESTSLDLSALCLRPVQVMLTEEDSSGMPSTLELLRLLDQSGALVSVTVLSSGSSNSEICSPGDDFGVFVNSNPMILRVLSPTVSIQALKETIFLNNPLVVDPIQELSNLFDSLFSENQLYADIPLGMLVVPFNSSAPDRTACSNTKLGIPGLLALLDSLSVFEVDAKGSGGSFESIDFCWQLCFPLDVVHSDTKNLFDTPRTTLLSVDLTFLTHVAPLCKISIARCLIAWANSTPSATPSELQLLFVDLMDLFDFFDLLDVVYDEWGRSFSPEWKAHCLMRLSNFADVLRSTANYMSTLPLSTGPNAVGPQWQQRLVASAHRALLHPSVLSKFKLQGLLFFVRKCLDTAWPKWIKDCCLGYIAWCEMKNPTRNSCLLSPGSDSWTLRHEWLDIGLWEHVSHKLDSHENVYISVSNNKLVVGLSSRRKNGDVESENSLDGMGQSQAVDLLCNREKDVLVEEMKARVGIEDSRLIQEVVTKLREHGCNTWSDFTDIFELVKYERMEENSGALYRNLKSFFIEDIHLPLIVAMKLSKFLVKFHMD